MNTLLEYIQDSPRNIVGGSGDFVFLRQPNGLYAIGEGPFALTATPPHHGAAFYVNDFAHGLARPWMQPRRFHETSDIANFVPIEWHSKGRPVIRWLSPRQSAYRCLFEMIQERIRFREIDKLVPVMVEEGKLLAGSMESLITEIDALALPLYTYGIFLGDSGMLGMSPEPIVSVEGLRLRTMALAGTAASETGAERLCGVKERYEHKIVVDYIASQLADLGPTRRGNCRPLQIGQVTHLSTAFTTQLDSMPSAEHLIERLHPTPAVGPFPRNPKTLALATAVREWTGTPRAFAAPFGVRHGESLHVLLTIRNVTWTGRHIRLPAGGGIVHGSRFEDEWNELRLKRDSVKQMLGLRQTPFLSGTLSD